MDKFLIIILGFIVTILLGTSPCIAQELEAELFFNSDPGFGNGIVFDPQSNESIDFVIEQSAEILDVGKHTVFVRARENNIWSHYSFLGFVVVQEIVQPPLVEGEFFYNLDPGQGSGDHLSFDNFETIDTLLSNSITGLTAGRHYLYFRVGTGDVWSHYHQMGFLLENSEETVPLSGAEFFINEDPGQGTATAVEIEPADEIDLSFELTPESLEPGRQFLHFRLRNGNTWSHYARFPFTAIETIENTGLLTSFQFFFNESETEPYSWDNELPIEPADSIDDIFEFPSSGLTPGENRLFVKLADSRNIMSHYVLMDFYYCGSINPVIEVDGAVLTCITDIAPNSWQWMLNGDTIPGATESIYTAMESGLYSVIVNYEEDCNELSEEVNIVIQSNENNLALSQLVIFPNPATNRITIRSVEIVTALRIYDLQGRMVYSEEPKSTDLQILTESFDSGVYVLNIETSQGIILRKLIIQ